MKNKRLLFVLSALVIGTMVSCTKKAPVDSTVSSADSVVSSVSDVTSSESSVASSTSSESSVSSSEVKVDVAGIIRKALEKDYENGTSYDVYSKKEKATNKVVSAYTDLEKQMESGKYYIDYQSASTAFQAYVESGEETFDLIYVKDNNTVHYTVLAEDWYYQDDYGYTDFDDFECCYEAPTNYTITPENYEYVDGKIVAKADKLQEEGVGIYGEYASDATFTSIELAFNDEGYFTKIVCSYEYEANGVTYVYTNDVTYSDIGTTTFTAPTNVEAVLYDPNPAPDHYDPATGVALTEAEAAAFDAAFAKTYTNYTANTIAVVGSMIVYDNFYYDGNKLEEVYKAGISFGDQTYLRESGSYLYRIDNSTEEEKVYLIEIDQNKECTESLVEDEIPGKYLPTEFKLSANDFVMVTETNSKGEEVKTYVIKEEALATLDTTFIFGEETEDVETLEEVDEAEEAEEEEEAKIKTVEVTLTDEGDIESVYYLIQEGEGREAEYTEYVVIYSSIGTTEVELPELGSQLKPLTMDDEDILKDIFAIDYTDYKFVYDGVTDSSFLYNGKTNGLYVQIEEDETGYVYNRWLIDEGKYYFVDESGEKANLVEKTKEDFNHIFPTINFSAIDLDKVSYDASTGGYFISADDVDMSTFIPYYDDAEFVASITGIEIYQGDAEEGIDFVVVVEYIDSDGNLVTTQGIEIYDAETILK